MRVRKVIFNLLARERPNRQNKYSHSQGMTLLEVVITIAIMAFLAVTLYQFFNFMNKESRAQISDQVFIDRLNLFFHNITKDFRTAKTAKFNDSYKNLYIKTVEEEENGEMGDIYTFKSDNKEIIILTNKVRDDEVENKIETEIEDGTEIVRGPIIQNPVITCEDNGSYYTRLYLFFSTPVGNYDLSVVRRNPPAGKEVINE